MLPQALDSLLNLVFPQFCHVCAAKVIRRADGVACEDCWRRTRILDNNLVQCWKCANPLTGYAKTVPLKASRGFVNDSVEARLAAGESHAPNLWPYPESSRQSEVAPMIDRVSCHRCDDHHYDLARAAGIYEHALAATIVSLKSKPFVPHRLGELLKSAFQGAPFAEADLIMPVPLSRLRYAERGYNQAELLANIISRKTGLPLDRSSFIRVRHTKLQRAAMDRRARELTVENSFEVARPKLIEGRKIVLIDDVLTSGATVSACAKVLKKQGAAKVFVFTAARAAGL